MIYNKTCLYSATAGTNSITLSEPLSAFERYVVKVSPGVYWESVCTGDRTVQRFNRYGDWNHQGYMVWPANWVISNGTTKLECNRFQMLWQNSAVNKVGAFGWGNTASNIKHMYEVWGINRKDYATAQGEGKPEGDWKTYNETLLWSGTDYANQSHITLNNRAIGYERLKIGVGSFSESTNILETDSPQDYTAWLPLTSYWGTTTASFYLSMHRYRWDNETSGLSAVSGKTWQLGTGAADPYATTGDYTNTGTYVRRPVWAIWGVNEKDKYLLIPGNMTGGTISANRNSGYEHDITTVTGVPASEDWKCSAINLTGATLTGNNFMFGNSNVTAQAEFEHSKNLYFVPNEHATLSADKMTGFSGDVVTVDTASIDEGWYFTGLNVTGAVATGNKFTFIGNDVTAEGLYTDEGYPITYETSVGGSCTGNTNIYIPGGTGITLQTAYNTYYRFSGYEVTGGTINGNVLTPNGPCTARAVYKVNYFTASGGFEKGSNVEVPKNGISTTNGTMTSAVPAKYATVSYKTSNTPTAWYATSNRWKVNSTVSAYSITLHPIMRFTSTGRYGSAWASQVTAQSLIGSTVTQSQSYSQPTGSHMNWTYNKTFTTTTTGVNYGISAKMLGTVKPVGNKVTVYNSTGTTGTWTATGIAP